MRNQFITRMLFLTPVVLAVFFGHYFCRIPFNPFVPYLTMQLIRSRMKPPLWIACTLGFIHDLLLPSPRLGAFALAYVLATSLLGVLLRKISSQGSKILLNCLIAGLMALSIELIGHSIIWILGIPESGVSFALYSYCLVPIGTLLITLALNALLLISTRRTHTQYE